MARLRFIAYVILLFSLPPQNLLQSQTCLPIKDDVTAGFMARMGLLAVCSLSDGSAILIMLSNEGRFKIIRTDDGILSCDTTYGSDLKFFKQ